MAEEVIFKYTMAIICMCFMMYKYFMRAWTEWLLLLQILSPSHLLTLHVFHADNRVLCQTKRHFIKSNGNYIIYLHLPEWKHINKRFNRVCMKIENVHCTLSQMPSKRSICFTVDLPSSIRTGHMGSDIVNSFVIPNLEVQLGIYQISQHIRLQPHSTTAPCTIACFSLE